MSKVNIVLPSSCMIFGVLVGLIVYHIYLKSFKPEGFITEGFVTLQQCLSCRKPSPCGCRRPAPCGCRRGSRHRCRRYRGKHKSNALDSTKFVLKSTIPPCPPQPDLSKYMLKTECPSVPDLSNYVLKSSIPRGQPVILDCSKCKKPTGSCPPCPRPRCPTVTCPPPTKCPAPAPCPRQVCPPTVVKCKAQDAPIQQVRPYLAPLSITGFGLG